MQPPPFHLIKNYPHLLKCSEGVSSRLQLGMPHLPFHPDLQTMHPLPPLYRKALVSFSPTRHDPFQEGQKDNPFCPIAQASYEARKHEGACCPLGVHLSGEKCIKDKARTNISNRLFHNFYKSALPS